ncbi:MAG: aldehyde ferredoxin oxidoreductase C-terminal domain-containing protein [Candidatus Helarchaeota archaeon]
MKIIRVDMSKLTIKEEELPEKYLKFGGRVLSSNILYDEVDPACNPLGADNKLIFANGLLAGSGFPNSSRLSVGAKSPLTNGIKESNVGGLFAYRMIQYGIRAIIIEGKPSTDDIYIVRIDKNGYNIEIFNELKGLGNYKTVDKLKDKYGPKIATTSIGIAGEMQLKAASIAVSNLFFLPDRYAGRGGLGAVMGSKQVKAIVLGYNSDPIKLKFSDKTKFKQIIQPFINQLIETKQGMTKYGTSGMTEFANTVGALPTKNYKYGSFDGVDGITHHKLHELLLKRGGRHGIPCSPFCVIRCSNIFLDKNGNRLTKVEYETIAMNGSNLGISDLDAIARINYLYNDLGLDTIECGDSFAVAMEGGLLDFGDADGVIKILEGLYEMPSPEEESWSRIIANGCVETGKKLNVKRIPAVKGQGMPAYDPRVFKAMGVTFATSPMGADHTAGPAIAGRRGMDRNKDYGSLSEAEYKTELSHDLQLMSLLCDCMGCCFFIGPSIDTMEIFAESLNALYGWNISVNDLIDIAKNTIKRELIFNKNANVDQQNVLPDFFYHEKLPPTNNVFDIDKEKTQHLWDYLLP